MSDFKLGDKVLFTQIVKREAIYEPGSKHILLKYKWVPYPAKPTTGILAGIRTSNNGEMRSDEDGRSYVATENFKTAIVYTDLKRLPVTVDLRHLEGKLL